MSTPISATPPPAPMSGAGKRAVATPTQTPPPGGDYYASAEGKTGIDLLRALHDLSARDHRVLSYEQAREEMFRTIEDPSNTNTIVDLYSGATVPGVSDLPTATAHGLTTEHVWPQSKGATEQARSDLHHMRAAFGTLNRHRSNLPYGEVVNPVWASPVVDGVRELSLVGYDERGHKVFSPRASMRGDLARDQLYFFTRYQTDRPNDYSLKNFRVSLPSLLKWATEDPVDDAERARNEAIFEVQGNRNPFVDHPSYVDKIGFSTDVFKRTLLVPPKS